MRMNEYRFSGFSLNLSQVAAEMVTLPNGDPPGGGLKMPRMKNVFVDPFENVIFTGDPATRWCFFA